MAIDAISGADAAPAQNNAVTATANNAFGLGFQDLLRIVLTQLTYQDPLKPMDNFEFVSQLAQFSQIQQTQTMSDRVLALLQAQATNQATGVLGRFVDVPSGTAVVTGKVTSVAFQSGEPQITIETRDGRTLSGISLTSVSRIGLDD
jgi:flagellar basal-body rod modification protein FlgD